MSKFVLVHGAWHGSWCWRRVSEGLEALGHEVVSVDLPGRAGVPPRPGLFPNWRTGIRECADTVLKAMGSGSEPVVLVGHSMGGLSITQAGEDAAERILSLVYVAALAPKNGEGAMHMNTLMKGAPITKLSRLNPFTGKVTLKFEKAAPFLYNACSQEDIDRARENIHPEPVGPVFDKVRTTPERWGRLDKLYIHCSKDLTVPSMIQKTIWERAGISRVSTLETGHSPGYSMPDELAALLAAEAERGRGAARET